RRRAGRRHSTDLPAQRGRCRRVARSARHFLEPRPSRLPGPRRPTNRGGAMTPADQAVVRREIVVNAPIADAFATFVERFGDFKPKEHNLLGAPITSTTFEPQVGGHIFDRAEDGSECHWARVLAYDPPDRVVFSWDISPRWQIESDSYHSSQGEGRFGSETPQRTR